MNSRSLPFQPPIIYLNGHATGAISGHSLRAETRDLYRARNRIAALMSALLGKRLESSVAAFRATLESLMASNRNFKNALEAGYVPIGQTATRLLAGDSFDPDEALEILQAEEKRRVEANEPRSKLVHPREDFNIDDWIEDLDSDHAVLFGIHQSIWCATIRIAGRRQLELPVVV